MPFHVEISSPVKRARVLNLDWESLRDRVLGPWTAGLPFEFDGGEWAPRESRLTILSGPALEASAGDDRWADALRAAVDVTREMLEAAEASAPAQTAVMIEASSAGAALDALRAGRPTERVPWSTAVERVGRHDPEVTAMILVVRPAKPTWPHP